MDFLISIKSDGAGNFTADVQKIVAGVQRTGEAMQQAGARSGGFIQAFKDFGKALLPAVGFAAAGYALQSLVRGTVAWAEAIVDASYRLGVSTDTLQRWEVAAKRSALTIEDLALGMRHLRRSIGEAVQGNKEAIRNLATLGVNIQEFRSRRPEDIFNRIMESLGKSKVSAVEFAAAIAVLGRSADRLYGAAQQGFAVIQKSIDHLASPETLTKLDEAGKKFTSVGERLKKGLAPILAWLADQLRNILDLLDMMSVAFLHLLVQIPGIGKGLGISMTADEAEAALQEIIDKRLRLEADIKAKAARIGKPSEPPSEELGFRSRAKAATAGGDEWRAMGLLGLGSAAAHIVNTQTDLLRQIARNTERIASAHVRPSLPPPSEFRSYPFGPLVEQGGVRLGAAASGFWPGVTLP